MIGLRGNRSFKDSVLTLVGEVENHLISDVYDRSLGAAALTLAGKTSEYFFRTFSYRNVEKDIDTYRNYYLTGVELVKNRDSLARLTRRALAKDGPFKTDPVYLATMRALEQGLIRERQFFMPENVYLTYFELGATKNKEPTKRVLSPYNCKIRTLGQYWGTVRPRAHAVSVFDGDPETIATINESLMDRNTKVDQSPVPRYMAPQK